jgi:vacuole morphology and inheritance protein 14
MTALMWIDGLFEINPDEIIAILPRLLTQLLPALASNVVQVRQAADKVNNSILGYVMSITDDLSLLEAPAAIQSSSSLPGQISSDRRESAPSKVPRLTGRESFAEPSRAPPGRATPIDTMLEPPGGREDTAGRAELNLDWEATISSLMDHFLNEHEETRAAALSWLTILHRKAPPSQKLVIDDSTFPALLKTLSDTSEQVVLRDLALLSQISKGSDDTKFGSFMVSLLSLFSTDRKLLETRGNLIIRQLCLSLNPERIFRTIADCLEKDDDVEFASIMIQNMNNNLITAPELSDMRRRLRNLDNRDGQSFFVVLFRSWCHNAVATLSLCLLAQAYEQAYHLLTIFADLEMNLNMLIQIDKLVQLLESPVFTCKYYFRHPRPIYEIDTRCRSTPPITRTRPPSLPL